MLPFVTQIAFKDSFFVSHATFFDVNYFFKSIVPSLDRCKELNIFVLYILHFVRSFFQLFCCFSSFFFFFVLCLFLV